MIEVIIPWRERSIDPYRAMNLKYVVRHWQSSGWKISVVGDGNDDGPFNRSRAYNIGARRSSADIIVYAEADLVVPIPQVRNAACLATENAVLVVPFTHFLEVDERQSKLVRSDELRPQDAQNREINPGGGSTGAVNVLSRRTLGIIGGYDERFSGAWWDDTAMHRAFEICCGPTIFVDGPAYHLYHATGARRDSYKTQADIESTARNRQRYEMYRAATTPEQIKRLIHG